MKPLALLVIGIAVFCDPIRDVMMAGGTHTYGWIARHIVKWLAFYPPLVYIVFTTFRVSTVLLLALAAQALWLCGLWVAGWPWTPWWLLKLKGWL